MCLFDFNPPFLDILFTPYYFYVNCLEAKQILWKFWSGSGRTSNCRFAKREKEARQNLTKGDASLLHSAASTYTLK